MNTEGLAGYDYKYDERGNIIESTPVNVHDMVSDDLYQYKYKYDNNDNQIEMTIFKAGKPVKGTYDYHKVTANYNSRNQEIENRYYDVSGNLTNYNSDKYAIIRYPPFFAVCAFPRPLYSKRRFCLYFFLSFSSYSPRRTIPRNGW